MQRANKFQVLALLLLVSLLTNTTSVSAARSKRRKTETSSKYSLNMISEDLLLNESSTLTIDGVTDEEVSFKSNDSSIVSISSGDDENSRKCTGESVGKATITVKIKEKGFLFFNSSTTTLTCRIFVSPRATSVRFNRKSIKMRQNAKRKLQYTLRPSITAEIPSFTSSNPDVATVTAAGKVTAHTKGTALIAATIKNGRTSICKIIVRDKVKAEKNN